MNVVVCVKQIPDPADPGRLSPDTHTLVRDDKLVIDDADAYGVELGLQLADAAGGEVTVVSMAPHEATSGLRSALAMGAARAILVSDAHLAGSDALSTAKVLAAAIRRAEPDLVIAATESTDGYTGTLPVQLAELLGFPSVSFVRRLSATDGALRADRQTESGYDEVQVTLPAVVTVTAGAVEPRYPSFKGIMAAKRKEIEQINLADLGIDPATVGFAGSRQEVLSVVAAPPRQAGEIVVDAGDAHERITAFLEQLKVI
jgi:electron transfer flavoprotein beta subunit